MSDEIITKGIEAVNTGEKITTRKLLGEATRNFPNDERSWGWFYNVAENDTERLQCVKQVLRINPNNTRAKQLLEKLRGSVPLSAAAGKSTRKMAGRRHRIAIWIAAIGFGIIVIISLYVVKNYRVWVGGGTFVLVLILLESQSLPDCSTIFSRRNSKKKSEQFVGQDQKKRLGKCSRGYPKIFLFCMIL